MAKMLVKHSTQLPQQYFVAEELEQYLGNPFDPNREFSFKKIVEIDEQEEYPHKACELLNKWNLHHYYIPIIYNGKLKSYEELFSLLRIVARRDLTTAIAHAKTFLGSVTTWVGATEQQKCKLANIIKNGGTVALAYHEKAHGSDFLATDVQAIKSDNGYRLSGEKWLFSNATRSTTLTVFTRTDTNGGPRGFSLFLVEKQQLEPSSYSYLNKIKTLGIRGADCSGIDFHDSLIPSNSLIGNLGSGLEITLKAFQLTRTVIPALSLGAADTALRTTLGFTLSRQLYGNSVFAIPHAQKLLVDAFLDILTCDCVAIATARAVQVTTEQMRLWSAIVKYFVPTTVEKIIHNLCVVLGARYYLREGYNWGIFQKIVRDSAVVSMFHAGTYLNLMTISASLQAQTSTKKNIGRSEEIKSNLESIFTLSEPLPDFESDRLELFSRGRDDILQGMEIAIIQLRDLHSKSELDSELLATLIVLANQVIEEISTQQILFTTLKKRYGQEFDKSEELFELAKNHCNLHTAATCLHMWLYNRNQLGEFFARGEWLILCLDKLMKPFYRSLFPLPAIYRENVAQQLQQLYTQDKLFSIVPFQLAQSK